MASETTKKLKLGGDWTITLMSPEGQPRPITLLELLDWMRDDDGRIADATAKLDLDPIVKRVTHAITRDDDSLPRVEFKVLLLDSYTLLFDEQKSTVTWRIQGQLIRVVERACARGTTYIVSVSFRTVAEQAKLKDKSWEPE